MSRARSSSKKSTGTTRRRKQGGFFGTLLELLFLTFPGKVLITGLALALVFSINILVTQNQFDRFFLYLGIELVLVAAFFWIRFLLKK